MSLPAFRPRSAPEMVDAAVQLAKRHYGPLGTLAALIAVPSLVIGLATARVAPNVTAQMSSDEVAGELVAAMPLMFLAFAWLAIGFGALIASAAAAYVDGRALDPVDALRRALRRAWALVAGHAVAALLVSVILTAAVLAIAIAFGAIAALVGRGNAAGAPSAVVAMVLGLGSFALVFVASLLLWSRYVNLAAAVMLEDRGPLAARRRSAELVKGSLRRTAGVVVIAGVIYLVVLFGLWGLAAAVTRESNLSSTLASALVVAIYPFIGSLLTVLYYDLRIRREGYDLELMARALEPQADGGGVTA